MLRKYITYAKRALALFKKGGVIMESLIPFISDVGFPIVVTLYLLHRIEAKLDTVVHSIQNLSDNLKGRTLP
jgi:hypothetical protein